MDEEFTDDLVRDTVEAAGRMNVYISWVNDNLDYAVDHGVGTEPAEKALIEAYKEAYPEIRDVAHRAIAYSSSTQEERLHVPMAGDDPYQDQKSPLPWEAGVEKKQAVEYRVLLDPLTQFHDVTARYLGIRYNVETMDRELEEILQDEDVELPGPMRPEEFVGVEYVDAEDETDIDAAAAGAEIIDALEREADADDGEIL